MSNMERYREEAYARLAHTIASKFMHNGYDPATMQEMRRDLCKAGFPFDMSDAFCMRVDDAMQELCIKIYGTPGNLLSDRPDGKKA